jgi:hypothetical protein
LIKLLCWDGKDTEVHGLPAGLPIIAGGGDNASAAIGLGISSHHLNRGSLSIGTSGVIFVPCDRPVPDPEGRVHLFCHVDGGYHLLGVTLAAGGSLRWYRETFAPHTPYPDLMHLAEASPPGCRDVLFLPHLSGERSPHLDPDTRGAWVNLSLAHTQADLIRAVLEGVAFSLRAVLEVIRELTPAHQLLATGGGARSPFGYLGTLMGYSYVHETMADPLIRQAVEHLMEEVTPTLQPLPGINLDDYKKTLIERFANPKIRDQLPRLCLNSSAKLPKWVLNTLRDKLQQKGAIAYLSLTVAAWFRYLNGQDDQGKPVTIDDPMAELLTQRAQVGGINPQPLLSLSELFGDLSEAPQFVETLTNHLQTLYQIGTKETLVRLC